MTLGQGRLDVGAEPMFTAVFGPSEDLGDEPQHRYVLRRFTRIGENYVCWVMLNPSIATPTIDDPTIRRVKRFSERWGFHNYVVVNLFAHRSTNPGQLRLVHDPVGPENDGHIETQARGSALVVCAWGSGGHLKGRDMAVAALLRSRGINLYAAAINSNGTPQHPLYLTYTDAPVMWWPATGIMNKGV